MRTSTQRARNERTELSSSVWFCLFFLALPVLEAGEARWASDGSFQSLRNVRYGGGNIGLGNPKALYTSRVDERIGAIAQFSVYSADAFAVCTPLFDSECSTGLANNSSFFGTPGGRVLDPSHQGSRDNTEDYSRERDESHNDIIVHDDAEEMLSIWGLYWL